MSIIKGSEADWGVFSPQGLLLVYYYAAILLLWLRGLLKPAKVIFLGFKEEKR